MKTVPSILIVEDNPDISYGLDLSLRHEGYRVRVATTVEDSCKALDQSLPDLMILDLMLPDGSGFTVLNRLRQLSSSTAVIILSAKDAEEDRVRGLRLGADDYVTKPFSVHELLERVRLRLPPAGRTNVLKIGGAVINLNDYYVERLGRRERLTRQEIKLLNALWKNRGTTVSRSKLLREAWGYPGEARTRTLDYFIAALRRKLEDDPSQPRYLRTVRGVGYQLTTDFPRPNRD